MARCKIFYRPTRAIVGNVEKYALATLTLHNYLRQISKAIWAEQTFVNSENADGTIHLGEW